MCNSCIANPLQNECKYEETKKSIEKPDTKVEDVSLGKRFIKHTDAYYKKKAIKIGKDYQTYAPKVDIEAINSQAESKCLARLEWCPTKLNEADSIQIISQ